MGYARACNPFHLMNKAPQKVFLIHYLSVYTSLPQTNNSYLLPNLVLGSSHIIHVNENIKCNLNMPMINAKMYRVY